MSEAIRQWFSRVTKSRVKIIAESLHEWQRIVIHGNECVILFLTCYFMSWTHRSTTNYHWVLNSPLLPRAVFSDLALWHHYNWSVASCERARYWYCDIIFVDCKLAQRRSSLVNNIREYRYPATRYSQLSMQDNLSTFITSLSSLWLILANEHPVTAVNKTDVERRQTLGHPRSINPNMISHVPQQLPIIF